MKAALTYSYELFWRGADADPKQLTVEVALTRWQPIADLLRFQRASTNLWLMQQTRLLMSLQ